MRYNNYYLVSRETCLQNVPKLAMIFRENAVNNRILFIILSSDQDKNMMSLVFPIC